MPLQRSTVCCQKPVIVERATTPLRKMQDRSKYRLDGCASASRHVRAPTERGGVSGCEALMEGRRPEAFYEIRWYVGVNVSASMNF
jgi:hypothetical protein